MGRGRIQDSRPDLRVSYVENLRKVQGVEYAVPVVRGSASVKASDGVDVTVQLIGTSEEWLAAGSRELEYGRFFTSYETSARQSICIIGSDVSERLFGADSPIGMELEMGGSHLTIIGTLEEQDEVMGRSQDDVVVVPWTIYQRWGDTGRNLSIMVKAESPQVMSSTMSGIRSCMRNLRGLGVDDEDDFDIMSTEELQEGFKTVSGWMFIGLLGLAGLSLVMGSVGIANIMLVSVTQRIREIGLRKALGATKLQIILQFLTESTILSVTGGIIGIVTGYLIALIAYSMAGIPVRLDYLSVFVAVLVSMIVGILAGIFPAGKAASLEPLKALQHES